MKRVGIVVPCMNNFKGLAEALESVKTGRSWTPYIMDNWRINKGVSFVWNRGIERAIAEGCDYILIINDDILFAPTTIDQLCEYLDKDENCIMITGCNKHSEIEDPYAILTYESPDEVIAEHPDFSCFMIRPNFFDQVGRFDEGFYPAYFEDNDMHYRIKLAGFKACSTTRAPYYHYGSVTKSQDAGQQLTNEAFEKNRTYYTRKWGNGPGYEAFTQPYNDKTLTVKDWHLL